MNVCMRSMQVYANPVTLQKQQNFCSSKTSNYMHTEIKNVYLEKQILQEDDPWRLKF